MERNNENIRQQVYLAALLHDIGKFWQRADKSNSKNSSYLSDKVKRLESVYCPSRKNVYTHKHVLWTSQFFETYSAIIPSENIQLNSINTSVQQLASAHHNPTNTLESIIQIADHYSSGVDRSKEFGSEDLENSADWESFKKIRIKSIFETILNTENIYKYEHPLLKTQFKKDFFPSENHKVNPDYLNLWNEFELDLKLISGNSFSALSEKLLFLLNKYTSCIPSCTTQFPDVSLFDHLKTTAAFAVCLYDYLNEQNNLKSALIKNEDSPILLIGADLSGIQSFIYNIISKNAAKNLKGRSFYLQLLVDTIVEKILQDLKLFSANVVYSSGGGFYVLAPNTEFVRVQLDKTISEIESIIYRTHNISLYLALDVVPITQDDIFSQLINEKWQVLLSRLSNKKRQKYVNLIKSDYKLLFDPFELGGDIEIDPITGEVFSKEELQNKEYAILGDDEQKIKKATFDQIRIGKLLSKADYWLISSEKLDFLANEYLIELELFSKYHYLIPSKEIVSTEFRKITSTKNIKIVVFNDFDIKLKELFRKDIAYDCALYGGNRYPLDKDGAPKTFDLLAGSDEDTFKRIGLVRMDVDNLGMVFSEGFADKKRTFSRYSSLSRSLDYFFKGYLNHIWVSNPDYHENSYIIYSGGDDLFIVGKWDTCLGFAEEIRNIFMDWVCSNPALTLSGGISILPGKFPVLKGADLAAKAEKTAKEHSIELDHKLPITKNSITVFGVAFNWEHEFPILKALAHELTNIIRDQGKISKGFIQQIQVFEKMRISQEKKESNPRWRWMIAYHFSRMKLRMTDQGTKDFINELQKSIFSDSYKGKRIQSNYTFLQILSVAARWAELDLK